MLKKVLATNKTGTVDYLRITQNRSDKVLTLLREYFYKQNNLYRAVKVAENPKSVAEQDELVINAIADGLSIEAIDKSNGNIIAAVVTRILTPNEYSLCPNAQNVTQSSLFVSRYISSLESMYNVFQELKIDCALDVMFLAVNNTYRRQNIATEITGLLEIVLRGLLQEKLDLRTFEGTTFHPVPKALVAYATTFKSQQMLLNLGYKEAVKMYNKEFTFNNVRLDQIIEPESPYCAFQYKKLI